MATARRRGIRAVVTALVLLAMGVGVALEVGDALGIRSEPAAQMQPAPAVAPPAAAPVPPPRIDRVAAPRTVRIGVAVDELHAAIADAPARKGTASLTVLPVTSGGTDDSYRLEGDAASLRVRAQTEAGAVRAVYDLAAQIRAAKPLAALLGAHAASRLGLRMTDLGAVGVRPDPAEWEPGTDYSHASKAFDDVFLKDPPYIDKTALAAAYADFDTFLRHSLANGYNAVAFPGFAEFVTFDDVPGGPVYAPGDEHRARALAMRAAFAPFWHRAHELGVKVYLRTDMLALTGPLQTFLQNRFGSLDTENPALWDVYTAGLDELYRATPDLDGVLIRIGEAGTVYGVAGWDYYSTLDVTTVKAVRTMLTAFTKQAEESGREVIFRTWSVGVGAVGDMHTNPASYEAVLKGIDSPALIVSTKYTLGDFYSWLPLNTTLEQGSQRRIVEFQSRREFENFGAFPNDLGTQYQWAMQQLLAANPHIEGVWVWTQDGGPWRAGPMTLYLKTGFWQLYELNTQLAGDLARDPATDVAGVTQAWARQYLSDDPATVDAITKAMTRSRDAIEHGLYIAAYAKQRVSAIGLEPPPMMWIFEWDILTGDSAVLDVLYAIVRDSDATAGRGVDRAIADGKQAIATVAQMRDLVARTDASTWRSPKMRADFVSALDYELNTLRMLGAYRAMILHQGQWHDTLAPAAHAAWQTDRAEFEKLAAAHLARYEGKVFTPALNLTAAQLGVQRADRDETMAWVARVLLAVALAWLVTGIVAMRRRRTGRALTVAARAMWIAATRPWRAFETTRGMPALGRALLLTVPAVLLVVTRAVQTSFLSWTHLAVVLGAWVLFALVVRLLLWRRSPWPVVAAVGGVVVLRCILTLFALSLSGPGGYWFAFWTAPAPRTAYITVAFALFVWAFVAGGWAMTAQIGARRATGFVLAAVGIGLLVPSAIVGAVGLETALTVWNDQMGLLPWGLSRILGITTYLGIPDATPWAAGAFAAVLVAAGILLALPWRRPVSRTAR
ncbi:hypothetical protein LK09_03010 [Microbacterium mangrovi]|uniref:Glycosyl hydrolase family 67 C-terminal domain-containing protein n=1 Tax=Microbacterium mangrovi TaxID=1348253 RepID=A0A0B2AD72_9MICO|nr:hypothetical protein [Microbacterium mangrovi]KHK99591.1 hypothetical protein LK09_03010 [Microbacterium mangrovi]